MTRTFSCLLAVCLVTSCQTTKPVKDTPAVAPVKKPEEAAVPTPVVTPENNLNSHLMEPKGVTQLPDNHQFQAPSNPAPTPGAPIRVVPPADPKAPQ